MPSEKILLAKQAEVAALAEEFKSAETLVVAKARGLTVAEDTAMRAAMREAGVTYKVVKNTLAKRAAEAAGLDGLNDIFVGPTAIAYHTDDVVAPAKLAKKYEKDYEAFEIKGGAVEGEVASLENILKLAATPDLETLQTQLAYVLNFPITKLAATLKAVVDKGEEEGQDQVVALQVKHEATGEAAAGVDEQPEAVEETDAAAAEDAE